MDPKKLDQLYREMVKAHPAFKRGEVHCMACGKSQRVNAAKCLRDGWPTCCGATMQLGRNVTT